MKRAKKPQRERKAKKPSEKINELNWHTFNFLENMLVFCILPEKSVPKESGVHFRITPNKDGNCICLLFEIDRKKDPLIKDKIKRPDFLVLYIDQNNFLFTIIEMKGTVDKDTIEQITNLRTILKNELRDNLPNKLKAKFQAIILTSYASQIPNELIAKVSTDDFVIRPLQYNFKAELFDFISQNVKSALENRKSGNKYSKAKLINNNLKSLEDILTRNALPNRKADGFCKANKEKATNKEGIYINYALPENDNYAVLAIDNAAMEIGVKESESVFQEQIKDDLEDLGLTTPHHFKIIEINP